MSLQDDVAPLPPKAFSPERKSLKLVAMRSEEQKAAIKNATSKNSARKGNLDKKITEDSCNLDNSEITPRVSFSKKTE